MNVSSRGTERRNFTRIHFDANTEIRQADQVWKAVLVDLSLNGLLIEEPLDWTFDKEHTLVASIFLTEEISIEMTIKWRYTNNGLVGFVCENIDLDSIGHLRRLVELNIGDTALLERELSAMGKEANG